MKLYYFALIFNIFCVAVDAKNQNYNHYSVFRVMPKNSTDLKLLETFRKKETLDFWTEISQPFVDIMVSPDQKRHFKNFMCTHKLDYSVFISNVQRLIDNESRTSSYLMKQYPKFDFKGYYRLAEINKYLESLEAKYPQAKVIIGGRSYEKRNITGIHVSYGSNKPTIIIEGGIHAREWISPATVLYILTEILTSVNKNVRYIAENYDWYFFPSINPDGYEYSHTKSRLWRKTRKPYGTCVGADANRNFNFHWNEIGTSKKPCREAFAGSHPFSEIEAKSYSQFVASKNDNLWAYIGFHSYAQKLLFPYGHTPEHLDNYDDLLKIGNAAAKALARRYGTKYTVGTVYETIYPTTGITMDWVKGVLRTPIAYSFELRDTGKYGFILPGDQIIRNGEEVLDSLVAIVLEAESLGY